MTEDPLKGAYIGRIGRTLSRLRAWRRRRRQDREAARLPVIDPELLAQVNEVEPSRDGEFEYRPCRVRLARDHEWRDRVYVSAALPYIRLWGNWPWEYGGKAYVPLGEVDEIQASPSRIPPHIATRIYEAGESGMGYCVFTLITKDGQRIPCLTGNAVDWVQLGNEVSPADVVDVLPHDGLSEWLANPTKETERTFVHTDPHAWCLYRVPG